MGLFYHHNAFAFNHTIHLHGFILSLGSQRLSSIRDITVHYADAVSGGMSLTELTFAQLPRLTSLRKLEVVMHGELAGKITSRYYQTAYYMSNANPARIHGMKNLFNLRGLTSIKVRDAVLEEWVTDAKKDRAYPDFTNVRGSKNALVVGVDRALQHFNAALTEAQSGNVQEDILDVDDWHMEDEFPPLTRAREQSEELYWTARLDGDDDN